jgi:hypothetical protein
MRTRTKKGLLTGGALTSAVLLAGMSGAYGCTVYRGNLTATGNGTGNASKTITGDPNNGTFEWCGTTPAFGSGSTQAQKLAFWTTAVSASAPSLTISTSVDSTSACRPFTVSHGVTTYQNNYLPTGTYSVGISNGFWDESPQGFDTGEEDNCHTLETSSGPGYGTRIDQAFSITNGVGSKTYSSTDLAGTVNSGWNTVCVYLPLGQNTSKFFNPANALNFYAL